MLTPDEIHLTGRIDQVVRDYFARYPQKTEVRAKDLMPLFISKGIFKQDTIRAGFPIRNLLRKLDAEKQLHLLIHCFVVRNDKNRFWYFKNLHSELPKNA